MSETNINTSDGTSSSTNDDGNKDKQEYLNFMEKLKDDEYKPRNFKIYSDDPTKAKQQLSVTKHKDEELYNSVLNTTEVRPNNPYFPEPRLREYNDFLNVDINTLSNFQKARYEKKKRIEEMKDEQEIQQNTPLQRYPIYNHENTIEEKKNTIKF